MSNQLSTLEALSNLPATQAKYADDQGFLAVAASSGFLPRVQIYSSNSKEVKRQEFPMGHYGLIRGKVIEDLGIAFDAVALSWRPKAMRFGEEVVSVFNPENAEFKKIQTESEESESGCAFGPEFLLYIPTANPPTFATLFFGNKTMRRESPLMRSLINKAVTMKVQLIETKKYSWHGPIIVPCSVFTHKLPEDEDIIKERDKFNNPPEGEVEPVPQDTRER